MATGAEPTAADAAAAAAVAVAASDVATADGRRTIALRIDACRSIFCCFCGSSSADAGSAAAAAGRFEPERTT